MTGNINLVMRTLPALKDAIETEIQTRAKKGEQLVRSRIYRLGDNRCVDLDFTKDDAE